MAKYRVMTFDGGGIRGALTAGLLERLVAKFPRLLETVDMFAGTSTGSFIALGLAAGKSTSDLVKLYSQENARYIFSQRYINIFRPRYNNRNLRNLLQANFPWELRLEDLQRRVVVPAFRVRGFSNGMWQPVFFNNFPRSITRVETVVDVALASSAAPSYFPSYRNYIDGGVVANNPSTIALAFALQEDKGRTDISEIVLLSMGTGYSPHSITADTSRWGLAQWALNPSPPPEFPLLGVLTEGVEEVDAELTARLLGRRQFRIDPALPRSIALDDWRQVPDLVALARAVDLDPAVAWLEEYWD